MPDDRFVADEYGDRLRPAGADERELHALARRHGLTVDEVREIARRVGDDRIEIEHEIARLKAV